MRQVRMLAVARAMLWSGLTSTICVACAAAQLPDDTPRQGPPASDEPVLEKELLEAMPVSEVTVFKDGHALILHEAAVPVSQEGEVTLSHLPAPVLGTFWPYVRDDRVKLHGVVAGRRNVRSSTKALHIQDMVRANVGVKARIKGAQETFTGTILSVPSRADASSPEDDGHAASAHEEVGSIVLVETAEGVRVIPLNSIQEVTFLDQPQMDLETRQTRNVLTLRLGSRDDQPLETARVGMGYLQRGIRWIPQYRLELDGQGKARVKLQATLINEMIDLSNVTAHLVIGVPHFAFKDTVDPIALGQMTTQLSQHFQEGSQTAFMLSNAIQTQVARMGEYGNRGPNHVTGPAVELGPDLPPGDKREDLFVFDVQHVSLKKGERMVVPLAEFELSYQDVYTVLLPPTPPPEMSQHFDSNQQRELAQLLHAPKAAHQARLLNNSPYPLTTAPAVFVREEQLLGQGMMTYTPIGASVDVEITSAVDITVTKSDVETARHPNAANFGGDQYDRVELNGEITLHNFGDKPVTLEVVRTVLGNVDQADAEGVVQRLNVREDGWRLAGGSPHWWHWHSWPASWFHLNGLGRITWTVQLENGKDVSLPYRWHYFWRR